ncbi:BZ3500_MvSof-1268-A1-R1_Chr1-1g00957 [Microbotryum saponariae]|uniref:BZ3500_MvSof-1268-A1-R1_Chr1-1g00957 protein n=1 Tax=Microbotryum saponariae TaxID=289078 RepID=A0A2X0KJT2_9BASI|nr:BZ3500_MvSof-1268-A1-R1_Chr1-1g00957 [Microbotryum saponariae]SCZ93027.1 BZ3501_MvSof-1269-A2-R1_Chr1-1g00554 [Microbotryum saponariae]
MIGAIDRRRTRNIHPLASIQVLTVPKISGHLKAKRHRFHHPSDPSLSPARTLSLRARAAVDAVDVDVDSSAPSRQDSALAMTDYDRSLLSLGPSILSSMQHVPIKSSVSIPDPRSLHAQPWAYPSRESSGPPNPPPSTALSPSPSSSSTSPRLLEISSLSTFAAEYFVYLWFAPPLPSPGKPASLNFSKQQSAPTDRFLSHSVVILALLLVSRLKARNQITGSPGSEFRALIISLMIANKVVDDNSECMSITRGSESSDRTSVTKLRGSICVSQTAYTAKTWADVSSLELKPLVAGEAEFLQGLEWSVHVTERDFNAWVKLLQGHISTRKSQHAAHSRPRLQLEQGYYRTKPTRSPLPSRQSRIELHGLGLDTTVQTESDHGPSKRLRLVTDDSVHSARRLSTGTEHAAAQDGLLLTPTETTARGDTTGSPPTFSFGAGSTWSQASTQSAPRLRPSSSHSMAAMTLSPLAGHQRDPPAISHAHALSPSGRIRHRHSRSIPPHITSTISPTGPSSSSMQSLSSDQTYPLLGASSQGGKRRADEAFGHSTTQQSEPEAVWLKRSISVGCSPAPPRAFYVHPAHMYPSPAYSSPGARLLFPTSPQAQPYEPNRLPSARRQSHELVMPAEGPFGILAHAYSPHPDMGSRRFRPEQLDYYSLAAGQRHGHLHEGGQAPPEVPYSRQNRSYAPTTPSHLGLSPSSPRHVSPRSCLNSALTQASPPYGSQQKSAVGFAYSPGDVLAPTMHRSASRDGPFLLQRCRPQFANSGPSGIIWTQNVASNISP